MIRNDPAVPVSLAAVILRRQLAVDLAAAADPRATVAVLIRYTDDRSALLRRGATRASAGYLGSVADGMQRLATDLDTAAREAWGDLAPHVPQPPQGPVADDRDLDAFELADQASETNRRRLDRVRSAAADRRKERRRG